mgnify:CR=1 FL=1
MAVPPDMRPEVRMVSPESKGGRSSPGWTPRSPPTEAPTGPPPSPSAKARPPNAVAEGGGDDSRQIGKGVGDAAKGKGQHRRDKGDEQGDNKDQYSVVFEKIFQNDLLLKKQDSITITSTLFQTPSGSPPGRRPAGPLR